MYKYFYASMILTYILVFESYARSPRNDIMMLPKEPGDFRERVERETIRG